MTAEGRRHAEALGPRIARRPFVRVLTSPLSRAADTCRLAGLGRAAEERDELVEWDYGEYEGRTTPEIREDRPGWYLWRDGCPSGETAADVGARADAVIAELRGLEEDVAVFAHGHVLRVFAARWIEQSPAEGGRLALSTGALSAVGWEREAPVIRLWNDTSHIPR